MTTGLPTLTRYPEMVAVTEGDVRIRRLTASELNVSRRRGLRQCGTPMAGAKCAVTSNAETYPASGAVMRYQIGLSLYSVPVVQHAMLIPVPALPSLVSTVALTPGLLNTRTSRNRVCRLRPAVRAVVAAGTVATAGLAVATVAASAAIAAAAAPGRRRSAMLMENLPPHPGTNATPVACENSLRQRQHESYR